MLQDFLQMVVKADMLGSYSRTDSVITYDGEDVEVINITVPTNDTGDSVVFTFHRGTEELIDMNIKHVCSCDHCHHN